MTCSEVKSRVVYTWVLLLCSSSAAAQHRSIDLGWLSATQEQQGWRVSKAFHHPATGQSIEAGDLLLAVDGQQLADLDVLSAAFVISRIPDPAETADVLRNGAPLRLNFFVGEEPLLKGNGLWADRNFPTRLYARQSQAPAIELRDESGNLRLVKYGPKWSLIHVWQPHCPPCFKDIPALNEVSNPPMDSLQLIAIVLGDGLPELQGIAKIYPIHFSNLIAGDWNDNQFATDFDVFESPTDVLVDPNGRVAFAGMGAGSLQKALQFFKESGPQN